MLKSIIVIVLVGCGTKTSLLSTTEKAKAFVVANTAEKTPVCVDGVEGYGVDVMCMGNRKNYFCVVGKGIVCEEYGTYDDTPVVKMIHD